MISPLTPIIRDEVFNARVRSLPKLMGGEMDVFLENYPAV